MGQSLHWSNTLELFYSLYLILSNFICYNLNFFYLISIVNDYKFFRYYKSFKKSSEFNLFELNFISIFINFT